VTKGLAAAASRAAGNYDRANVVRTVWFNGNVVVPGAPGIYEKKYGLYAQIHFSKWDGVRWYLTAGSPGAADQQTEASGYQDADWRGLLEQPT
jgi:hypothetical protein